jgi:hypothetical protein
VALAVVGNVSPPLTSRACFPPVPQRLGGPWPPPLGQLACMCPHLYL